MYFYVQKLATFFWSAFPLKKKFFGHPCFSLDLFEMLVGGSWYRKATVFLANFILFSSHMNDKSSEIFRSFWLWQFRHA
jgi:hypothetical protein